MLKRIIAARRIQERFNEDVEKSVEESLASMRKLSLDSEENLADNVSVKYRLELRGR